MKNILLLAVLIVASMQSYAQKLMEKDVPKATSAAFHKANPTVKDIDWKKDGANYMASYEMDHTKMFCQYSDSGKLTDHGMEIVPTALPAGVATYVKANYDNDSWKDSKKHIDANGVITYSIEAKDNVVWFDSAGDYMKSMKK
jgi:hypothetical protein